MCFCEKSQSKPGKTPRSVWNVSIVVNRNSTSPLHPACKCLCSSCVKFLPMLRIKTAQVHRSKQHQSFLNRSLKVTNRQITKKKKERRSGRGKRLWNKTRQKLLQPQTPRYVFGSCWQEKHPSTPIFFFLLRPLLGKKHPKGSPKINQQVHHECPVCKCVYGRKKENVKIWGKCYTTWCTRCLNKASE